MHTHPYTQTNRHIYNPLVSMGMPKFGAQLSVFALSAAFHEVSDHVTVTWLDLKSHDSYLLLS